MSAVQNIDWEIQQICHAIDYYERAYKTTLIQKEAESFKNTIEKLNLQLKERERERDGWIWRDELLDWEEG